MATRQRVQSAPTTNRTRETRLARAIALARVLASTGSAEDSGLWSRVEVTMPQLKVLAVLAVRGPTRAGALATALGVRPPTVTGILGRLARQGFIGRHRSAEDRRITLVALSRSGATLIERLFAAQERALAGTLRQLGPSELVIVVRAFELLVRTQETSSKAVRRAQTGRSS